MKKMKKMSKVGKSNSAIIHYIISAVIVLFILAIPILILSFDKGNRTSEAASVQPIGQTTGWELIFSDEFNATSLDTSKWTPGWFGTGITGPVNSAEIACYDSALATVPGDGNLHLKFIQQQNTCKGSTRPYTGSLISSNGKFEYAYGYVEFRAFLPAASPGRIANWPATWSDGQNWPTDGENDTMEGLSSGQACYHFHSPSGGPGGCATGDYTGWHTFGSDWQPGKVTYYYDGIKVGEITTGITSAPQYLIMDNTAGTNSTIVAPAEMLVDYVRVWKKCTTNCEPTPTTESPTPTPLPTATPVPTATPTPLPIATPVPTTAPVMNLLKNNSFEGTLSPWAGKVTYPASATINTTTSTKVSGSYAAQINVKRTSANAWYVQLYQGGIPITAGKTYTITFWGRASKNLSLQNVIQQHGGTWKEYSNRSFSLTTSWKKFTYTFTAPVSTTAYFTFNAARTTGTIWIDSASLTVN